MGLLCYFICIQFTNAQINQGDLSFVAFNSDGDDDFAIMTYVDLMGVEISFSDGTPFDFPGPYDGFTGTDEDSLLTWIVPSDIFIPAGSIVIFNDVSTENRKASLGLLTAEDNDFNLEQSGDALYAMYQDTVNEETVWICGIQNAAGQEGSQFGITGLTMGSTFIEFYTSGDPDAGYYSALRHYASNYADYQSNIANSAAWTTTDDGESIVPFSFRAFTIHNTYWLGNVSDDWMDATNWSNGIPDINSLVSLAGNTSFPPSIKNNSVAIVGNLTIGTTEHLTIESGSALFAKGILYGDGTFTVQSGASIFSQNPTDTSEPTFIYKRTVTDDWHLISVPFANMSINDFTTGAGNTNDIALSPSNNYGISYYNNSSNPNEGWEYYNTSNISSAGNFVNGKGYAMLRNTPGDYTFTGDRLTEDVEITIEEGTTNSWNLVGNPYMNYISGNTAALTTNLLSVNAAVLDPAFTALYFWDGISDSYLAINQASAKKWIHPGQGFFVKAIENGGSSTFQIQEEMQGHTTDQFYRSTSNHFELTITAKKDNLTKFTEVKYIEGTTTGLDPGFDAGMFDGQSSSFAVYTHLVNQSDDINYIMQCLPNENYDEMVVPVGITASAGSTVTFEISSINQPNELYVYLEDRDQNQFVLFDQNQTEYQVILDDDYEGVGRFYLHTVSQEVLSNSEISFTTKFSVFLDADRNLHFLGIEKSEIQEVSIYNILGQEQYLVDHNSIQENWSINIPERVSSGIYIVKLTTQNNQILTNKIIIP